MKLEDIPRQTLGFFPTPIVKLSRLSKLLGGPVLFMKRDDNTGLAMGGNKTRKLEYILADAIAKGADTIITAGAMQSNHCRQTAAAAASLQLECHLVLGGTAPSEVKGNLLLDQLFGSHIHWSGENRKGEDIPVIFEKLKKSGKSSYTVPYGGSNELGAIAFVNALKELDEQIVDYEKPFTHIVFASSSGGTHAGLMLGKKILNATYEIVGINIDKDESDKEAFNKHILSLANGAAKILDLELKFSEHDLVLDSNYIGDGYGVVGDLEREAIGLVAQSEGVLIDPVYTGRAMGALIDMVRTRKIDASSRVLFWHTGGTPALFAYSKDLVG